ncbi:calcium-binding protein [Pseudaestuariivita rosea]|uniref:calcium-binding protein n=1 Tax=Pseudaestuariivita rosea TaxID=2763263 RepID=UPI001ABA8534|nr:calcium-binding protein [Pseudaestuariivita rosea]
MATLTQDQLAILNFHAQAGDRIAYYEALERFGDAYGELALGVVLNNTLAGQAANNFLENTAEDEVGSISNNQLALIGLQLMQADNAVRQSNNGNASIDDIQRYHELVFGSVSGVSANAWTPNYYLQSFSTASERQSAWDALVGAGPGETYLEIAARRIEFIQEYLDGLENPPFTDPLIVIDEPRQFLIDAGLDANFVDYVKGYGEYLTELQFAGFGAALPGPSGPPSPYDVSIQGAGQMIAGDASNDEITGTSGSDVIMGFSGNDALIGGNGNDRIYGDIGIDVLVGGRGADVLNGCSGRDEASYSLTAEGNIGRQQGITVIWTDTNTEQLQEIWGRQAYLVDDGLGSVDTIMDTPIVVGSSFDDTFVLGGDLNASGELPQHLDGSFVAIGGEQPTDANAIVGDTIDLSGLAANQVTVDLIPNTVSGGSIRAGASQREILTIVNIENAIGTNNDDTFLVGGQRSEILGLGGSDIVTVQQAGIIIFDGSTDTNGEDIDSISFEIPTQGLFMLGLDNGGTDLFVIQDAFVSDGFGYIVSNTELISLSDGLDFVSLSQMPTTPGLTIDGLGMGDYLYTNDIDVSAQPAGLGGTFILEDETAENPNTGFFEINGQRVDISGFANLRATNGTDTIQGSADQNTIEGFGGNDTIIGLDGFDLLSGDEGDDVMIGGIDFREMTPTEADYAADTVDILYGGAGFDTYHAVRGDQIYDVEFAPEGQSFGDGEVIFEGITLTGGTAISPANAPRLSLPGAGLSPDDFMYFQGPNSEFYCVAETSYIDPFGMTRSTTLCIVAIETPDGGLNTISIWDFDMSAPEYLGISLTGGAAPQQNRSVPNDLPLALQVDEFIFDTPVAGPDGDEFELEFISPSAILDQNDLVDEHDLNSGAYRLATDMLSEDLEQFVFT